MTNVIFGLNRIAWRHAPGEAIIGLGISTVIAIVMIAIFDALSSQVIVPLAIKILAGMLAFLGFSIARYRERILTGLATSWLTLRGDANHVGERVIIIGAGELGIKTSWYIRHGYLKRMVNIVGFVDDNVYKDNLIFDESPVLGRSADIPELVKKHQVNILVFAIDTISDYHRRKIEAICRGTDAQTIHARDLFNAMGSAVSPQENAEDITRSREDVAKFLDQLDACLAQNDLQAAQDLVRRAQEFIKTQEKEDTQ